MKGYGHRDDGPPAAMRPRPAAHYSLISVTAPFLGALGHWPDLTTGERWAAGLAMTVLTGSCLVGLTSACAAFARRERLWGFAALGLVLNAPLLLLFLRLGWKFLSDWWRFG